MAGAWTTISAGMTTSGTLNADVMILLTNGDVLVHNGYVTPGVIAPAAEWLRLAPDMSQSDPNQRYAHGTWSSTINMVNSRQFFASGVLRDGRVFAIGGEYSDAGSDTPLGETFDPLTNTWSALDKPAAFNWVIGDCNGAILPDGRVLIGAASTTEPPSTWIARTALWDPSDDSWVEAGLGFGALATTSKTDSFEEESWGLLADGSVLAPASRNAPNAERYVPAQDLWVQAASSPQPLALQTFLGAIVYETGGTIALPDGRAFAVGGPGNTALFTPGAGATDLGSWAAGPNFPPDTSSTPLLPTLTALDSPVCLLPSGKAVCLGGTTTPISTTYLSQTPVFFEYDPNSSATVLPQLDVQPLLPSGTWTYQCWFLLLPTGQLLCSAQTGTLFLYTPDPAAGSPDPSWKPANISAPATMATGHSYAISGTQINGLSQAVAYGDDGGMATNYPIVEMTHVADGAVQYVRSHDFSTLGIARGNTVPDDVQSCTIDIPPNMADGDWNLVVIANGIRSDPTPIQIVTKDCFFIVENSTFSVGEVDSWLHATPSANAVFDPAFFVVVEGYTPAEIGLDTSMPIDPQLAAPPHIPNIPNPLPGMQVAFRGPMMLEDVSLPPTSQRFTFPFKITFTADSMFGAADVPVTLNATFTGASGGPITSSASLVLSANPNPFILHGDQTLSPPEPWYLSQDLRVFQVVATPGAPPTLGATLGTTGTPTQIATTYIQNVIQALRNNVGTARASFDALHQDEDSEILALSPTDPATGHPVYNFAVAKVRFRDNAPAGNVRVFFRAWQAQQTNAVYDQSTTYARRTNPDGQPIPVLGLIGDEIVSIPFFAQPRVLTSQHLSEQRDDHNRHTITNSPGETDYYFGCWLDVNQPDPQYPQRIVGVSSDGPFDAVSPLFPIQQFMRAAHQCLIAEIAYDPDHIPQGADPSTSDKLAQRNLAFGPAPNPGRPASRRVPQTFEIRPTRAKLPSGVRPDELMIVWDRMPNGATAEIYLPTARADAMLATADALYSSHLLHRVDAHTVRFPARGVTYLPVPPGGGATYAGLLTVDLPQHIRKGDVYEAVVRQLTDVFEGRIQTNATGIQAGAIALRTWRRTTGSFKLTIPVSTKELLLAREENYLAILKWIGESIHVSSRWYLVFKRFLEQIAGRVVFMGGDPGRIPASGNGFGPGAGRLHHGQHGRHGRDHDARFYAGKVVALVYDAFGDFTGFTLETNDGDEHAFESREHRMEELAERALDERRRVAVVVREHARHRPVEFIVLE